MNSSDMLFGLPGQLDLKAVDIEVVEVEIGADITDGGVVDVVAHVDVVEEVTKGGDDVEVFCDF